MKRRQFITLLGGGGRVAARRAGAAAGSRTPNPGKQVEIARELVPGSRSARESGECNP
jgi:hypothetical protein